MNPQKACRIACFSPCIEQVQRTLVELKAQAFCEIEMMECVVRPLEVDCIALGGEGVADAASGAGGRGGAARATDSKRRAIQSDAGGAEWRYVSRHLPDIKGHTSYLYFATLLPSAA